MTHDKKYNATVKNLRGRTVTLRGNTLNEVACALQAALDGCYDAPAVKVFHARTGVLAGVVCVMKGCAVYGAK